MQINVTPSSLKRNHYSCDCYDKHSELAQRPQGNGRHVDKGECIGCLPDITYIIARLMSIKNKMFDKYKASCLGENTDIDVTDVAVPAT